MAKRSADRFGWNDSDIAISPLSDRLQTIANNLPSDDKQAAVKLKTMLRTGDIDKNDLAALLLSGQIKS